VTGFVKTLHVCTRIEIHFIVYCKSYTHVLSRHNDKTGIDKQVCFYRRPVVDPVKSWRTIIDPVRLLWDINRVAWVQICPIIHLCGSWYSQGYCGHQSGPLCTQLGHLYLMALLTHPPNHPLHLPHPSTIIRGTHDIAGCFQSILQNQPVQPVAIYVSVMIRSYYSTKHK